MPDNLVDDPAAAPQAVPAGNRLAYSIIASQEGRMAHVISGFTTMMNASSEMEKLAQEYCDYHKAEGRGVAQWAWFNKTSPDRWIVVYREGKPEMKVFLGRVMGR